MFKIRRPRSLSEFLRDHDVPCPTCAYNLRGGASTTCPECGSPIPYTNLEQFIAEYKSFHRVETTEYQMYRFLARYVATLISFNALLMLFATQLAQFPVRLVLSLLGLLFAGAIFILRRRLYVHPDGADYVTDPRAERTRDRFGAFCLILAIPVTATVLVLIGFVR